MQHYFFNKATAADNGKTKIIDNIGKSKIFHYIVKGAGETGSMFKIEYSNNGEDFFTVKDVTIQGNDLAQDFFKHDDPWHYVRVSLIDVMPGTELTIVASSAA